MACLVVLQGLWELGQGEVPLLHYLREQLVLWQQEPQQAEREALQLVNLLLRE